MSLLLQPVRVATGSADEKGCLVLDSDQRLVAVLVELSNEHEGEVGHWFFEVGFGPMDGPDHPTFLDLDAAQEWITERMAKVGNNLRTHPSTPGASDWLP